MKLDLFSKLRRWGWSLSSMDAFLIEVCFFIIFLSVYILSWTNQLIAKNVHKFFKLIKEKIKIHHFLNISLNSLKNRRYLHKYMSSNSNSMHQKYRITLNSSSFLLTQAYRIRIIFFDFAGSKWDCTTICMVEEIFIFVDIYQLISH